MDSNRNDILMDILKAVNDVTGRGVVAGTLGAPVDIASMAMRPLGYKNESPVGGSDWIAEKLNSAGLISDEKRPVAEMLSGMLTPGGVASGALKGLGLLVGATKGKKLADALMGSKNLTPAEKAHSIAQRNAALPLDKGGLGLGANNTPMERAAAMGFDTDLPLYHGTARSFPEFKLFEGEDLSRSVSRSPVGKLGVSLAVDPALANEFAYRAGKTKQNVLPVLHRADGRAGVQLSGSETNDDVFGTVVDAWKQGIDGLMFKNYSTPELKNQKFILVKNPNQVRSVHAAFDPKKKNSANLLAGGAAGAVGLGLLGGDIFDKGSD